METPTVPWLFRKLRGASQRAILAPWGRRLATRILNTAPIPVGDDTDVEVHTLMSRNTVVEGLWAIKSFLYFSGLHLPLYVHDDGTLDGECVTTLQNHFPGIRIVLAKEADAYVLPLLKAKGALFGRLYRSYGVFGRKLYDFYLHGTSRRILYLDIDILFFRRPDLLVDLITQGDTAPNVFMKDVVYTYNVTPELARSVYGIEVVPFLNAGLGLMARRHFDVLKVEEYLKEPDMFAHHPRVEQTTVALMASQNGFDFLPASYRLHAGYMPLKDDVCRHYVTCARHLFYAQGIPQLVFGEKFLERLSPHATRADSEQPLPSPSRATRP